MSQLQPVPAGTPGEVCFGACVARGYLQREELTAERFVPNPWRESDPSGRGVVYRTGDRVRWYADGELEFGGRIDFQVKLRGQRIELGEIEHALRSQPGVDEAVVLLDTNLEALVAYVSPAAAVAGGAAEGGFTAAASFSGVPSVGGVAGLLPSYMVPSFVVGVGEWPRTSSAKIDRKMLPSPDVAASTADVVLPRTEAEAVARDVFASVLGLEAEGVSVEASFFELGGNSLTAVRAAQRLQLPSVSAVFLNPTPAKLAPLLSDVAGALQAASASPPPPPSLATLAPRLSCACWWSAVIFPPLKTLISLVEYAKLLAFLFLYAAESAPPHPFCDPSVT